MNDRLGLVGIDLMLERRSICMATVSATGWPYLQHRGGPRRLLKVLDDWILAFADYTGNRQFISVGNLADNERVALILVDYARRIRLKLLCRMTVDDQQGQPELEAALVDPAHPARAHRRW